MYSNEHCCSEKYGYPHLRQAPNMGRYVSYTDEVSSTMMETISRPSSPALSRLARSTCAGSPLPCSMDCNTFADQHATMQPGFAWCCDAAGEDTGHHQPGQ